jgi:hypothetical protein
MNYQGTWSAGEWYDPAEVTAIARFTWRQSRFGMSPHQIAAAVNARWGKGREISMPFIVEGWLAREAKRRRDILPMRRRERDEARIRRRWPEMADLYRAVRQEWQAGHDNGRIARLDDRIWNAEHLKSQALGRLRFWMNRVAAAQGRNPVTDRHALALDLRENQGLTYAEIGKRLCVSGNRARQIVVKAQRIRDVRRRRAATRHRGLPPPRPADHPDFGAQDWTPEQQWREFQGSGAC